MDSTYKVIPFTANGNLKALQDEALAAQKETQEKAAAYRETREALDVTVNKYNSYVKGIADTLEIDLDGYRLDLEAGRFVELTAEEKAKFAAEKAEAEAQVAKQARLEEGVAKLREQIELEDAEAPAVAADEPAGESDSATRPKKTTKRAPAGA